MAAASHPNGDKGATGPAGTGLNLMDRIATGSRGGPRIACRLGERAQKGPISDKGQAAKDCQG